MDSKESKPKPELPHMKDMEEWAERHGVPILSQEEAIKRFGRSFAIFVKSRPRNTPKPGNK